MPIFLGSNDLILLALLEEAPSYGYELLQQMRHRTGEAYFLKETTLYAALVRLERTGAVESYPGQESQGRPRTYFRLTQAGLAQLEALRQDWAYTLAVTENLVGPGAGAKESTDPGLAQSGEADRRRAEG